MLYPESSFCIYSTILSDMLKDQIAGFFSGGELEKGHICHLPSYIQFADWLPTF